MSWSKEIIQLDYKFLDIVVEGNYRKGEENTYDYQGSPSEFEIENIRLVDDKQDLYNLFEQAKWLKDLNDLVINIIEK